MDPKELRKIAEEYHKKKLEVDENKLKLEFIKKVNATFETLPDIAKKGFFEANVLIHSQRDGGSDCDMYKRFVKDIKKLNNYNKALTEAHHGLPQIGEGLRDSMSLNYNNVKLDYMYMVAGGYNDWCAVDFKW